MGEEEESGREWERRLPLSPSFCCFPPPSSLENHPKLNVASAQCPREAQQQHALE